jgi:hypothetical protein
VPGYIQFRTRNDLVNEALMNLGVLAAGQSPDAEDFAAVNGKVDALYARLEHQDIIDLDNSVDEIPSEIFNQLAVILADDAALEFGLAGVPPSQSNPNPVAAAIDSIRRVTYARPTYQPLRTEWF